MSAQKGFAAILVIIGIAVLTIGGLVSLALLGQAPQCPNAQASASNEKELAETLDKNGAVSVSDGQATAIAQKYIADTVKNGRVCFTPAKGNASGNIALGPFTPSFYASAGIDLSGSTPHAVGLDIKVGSLPDIPVLSSQVKDTISNLVNQNLAKVELKKKYQAQFSPGSVTVTKLHE